MKKKIVFMTYYLDCGGVEVALLNLLHSIDREKYDIDLMLIDDNGGLCKRVPPYVRIITPGLTPIEKRLLHEAPRTVFRSEMKKTGILKTACLCMKYLYLKNKYKDDCAAVYRLLFGKKRFDYKYDAAFDFHGYNTAITYFVAENIDAPIKATWLHCTDFINKRILLSRPQYEKYDRIFGVSSACCRKFVEYFPDMAKKTETFYNLIDTEKIIRLASEECVLKGKLSLVTVGRLTAQKGYIYAVDAAKLLKDRGLSFVWYFIGPGEDEEMLKAKTKELSLDNDIIFTGYCDNPFKYIANCDIYIQPSLWEGFCTTITEAKILARPIIFSDIASAREQINDGENGVIVKPGDAESLAEAIESLTGDRERRERFSSVLKNGDYSYASELKKLYRLMGDE